MGRNSWITLSSNEFTESSSVMEGREMLRISGFWKKYILSQVINYEIFGL